MQGYLRTLWKKLEYVKTYFHSFNVLSISTTISNIYSSLLKYYAWNIWTTLLYVVVFASSLIIDFEGTHELIDVPLQKKLNYNLLFSNWENEV